MEQNLEEHANHRKGVVLLVALLLITIAGAFVPASWFGIKNENASNAAGLTSVDTIDITPKNKETDQPLTWKEIAAQNFSDDPETLAKLSTAPVDSAALAQLNDETNITASLSKDLFVASAYLKQNGVTDETAQQQVISQLVSQEAAKIVPTKYSVSDIHISKTESPTSIRAYGNSVANILNGFITIAALNADLTSMDDFTKTQDPASLIALKNDSKKVSATLDKLAALSIPPSATIYHLAAINTLAAYKDLLSNMSKADTDPLRANIALRDYTSILSSTISIYRGLADYFDIKNIVFSGKEAGYVFSAGYTIK